MRLPVTNHSNSTVINRRQSLKFYTESNVTTLPWRRLLTGEIGRHRRRFTAAAGGNVQRQIQRAASALSGGRGHLRVGGLSAASARGGGYPMEMVVLDALLAPQQVLFDGRRRGGGGGGALLLLLL